MFLLKLLHCYCRYLYAYLYTSQTNRKHWKHKCPQTESIHCIVKASLNHPFWLRATITPGTQVSSGIVCIPLKTLKGFSFLPSAIAARMTVNLPLSWPEVWTEMDRSPTLDIVISSGISSHKGVSSILPIEDKGYWWRSHISSSLIEWR